MWVVYAPTALRGEPSGQQQDLNNAPKYSVHINRTHEPWNIYRILRTGQRVQLKLEVVEINRYTNMFDAEGMPLYNVPTSIVVNIAAPPQPAQGQ